MLRPTDDVCLRNIKSWQWIENSIKIIKVDPEPFLSSEKFAITDARGMSPRTSYILSVAAMIEKCILVH